MDRDNRNEHEYHRRSLVRGVAHAKAKEKQPARKYLKDVYDFTAERRQKAKAAYWLARISETKEEAADWLKSCLAAEPSFAPAQRALMVLEGELNQEEIVNPDRLAAADTTPHEAVGARHECPQCGGHMAFSADGDSLTCSHCGYATTQIPKPEIEEQSFAKGMALAKGHRAPVAVQFFECQSCGANYQLAPETLTITCAHCDATYTIEQKQTKDLIPPDGILPFDTEHEQAVSAIQNWLKDKNISEYKNLALTGVYLPVWTFDIGGGLDWTVQVYNNNKDSWETKRGTKAVFFNDLPVHASKPISKPLEKILDTFNTESAEPYDDDFTANWIAETYQISMSDAALDARASALKEGKKIIRGYLFGQSKQLHVSSTGISIQTFKLLLLPVWLGHYVLEGKTYAVCLNGTDLTLNGELPPSRIQKFFNWVIGKD